MFCLALLHVHIMYFTLLFILDEPFFGRMGSGPGNLAQADKRVGWLPGREQESVSRVSMVSHV